MSRLRTVLSFIGHYKYVITLVVGIALVGFVDENSFLRRAQLSMQISDLRNQIDQYNAKHEADNSKLYELKHNPAAYEKIARERYFMKTDDEDIFVLSDDETTETQQNETAQ